MKIALIQGRLNSDRPAESLERLTQALNSKEAQGAELTVFPALSLSGRLGPAALARPGLDLQYRKVWDDFLALSKKYPETTIASSVLAFGGPEAPVEKSFLVRAGEAVFGPAGGPAMGSVGGLKTAVWPGGRTPAGREADSDLVITLNDQLFEGQPYYPPQIGPAPGFRINVSNVGGQGPYIYDGATWVFNSRGELKGWAYGFESTMVILDTLAKNLPTLAPLPVRHDLDVLHQALTAGLRDFVRSTGGGKVVLGLSGGLDSALVALLAVDALGADNVLGVGMPSEYNSPDSLNLARDLAKNLGIQFLTIPIDGVREAFTRSFLLTPKSSEKAGHLADENIQARIRAVLLMYLANREDRLVLATGNKSEAAMGYSTLYGDTCGAIAPIGDVYKVRLFDLAHHLNRNGERIPEGIITRPPSAELRPDQKDSDSLPPYEILDDILRRNLEGGQSGSRIAKEGGHSAMTVAWVLSTVKKSAFKRSQEPFSLVASPAPLAGLDWPVKPV